MATNRNRAYLVGLVRKLRNLPHETEWAEFKVNHREPQTIGEYVSALSNAAALHGKVHAYIMWGVENGTHDISWHGLFSGCCEEGQRTAGDVATPVIETTHRLPFPRSND